MSEQALDTAHVIAALVAKNDSLTDELRLLNTIYENLCDEHNIIKARIANLRDDCSKKEAVIANLKEELRFWTDTAGKRLDIIARNDDKRNIISDLQAKSDSDEAKIYELQTKNDGLRIRLISIRNSVELHTKDVS
jgi:chromosome segregation ATPase